MKVLIRVELSKEETDRIDAMLKREFRAKELAISREVEVEAFVYMGSEER